MQLIHVTPLLTTTERPSFATRNAIYWTPFSRHFAASDCLIGLDAFDKVRLAPAEALEPAAGPRDADRYLGARVAPLEPFGGSRDIRPTVLEPSAEILPETPVRPVEAEAAAASASARTATMAPKGPKSREKVFSFVYSLQARRSLRSSARAGGRWVLLR